MGVAALLMAGVCAAPVQASMVLSNVIVHFEPGEPTRQDIDIENTGDEPMYVDVKPHLVLNPGTDQEQRQLIRDPRSAGLLVTPNRLVIAPRSRKRLRMVNLNPGSKAERVYRVAVTPVVGDLTAEQSGLKILIGYEVLVLAQPVAVAPQLHVERVGRTLQFENLGNTNVLLRDGHQCEQPQMLREACMPLASRRLYPGNRWAIDLPLDQPARYHLGIGTQNEAAVYQ